MPFSWSTIEKPLVALAPMSGVSDIAMRSVARRWGSDVTFSEFISTDALYYKPGNPKSLQLAEFIEGERPFIIQVFGPEPEHYASAVKELAERFKPDGFDVNFGCPARSVVNNGAGSCLFLQPDVARRIIETVKEASGNLPTSIKLRASYKHVPALDFLNAIAGAPFENVTVHMRKYEQVHFGEPNWDAGKGVSAWCHARNLTCIVNGGINSAQKAKDVLAYTGADGVMVAQASLGNPFLFSEIKAALGGQPVPVISPEDRLGTVLAHARLMLEHKGEYGLVEMRKHLVWYFKGFPGAAAVRQQLTRVTTLPELEAILGSIPTV